MLNILMIPIHVLGWYGKENIGDESYKISIPKLFPDHEFTFGEEVIGKPNTIILGGGDVISPYFINTLKKYPEAKKYALSVNVREKDDISVFDKVLCRNITEKAIQCPDFAFILEPNRDNGRRILENLFKKYNCDLYDKIVIVTLNGFLCVGDNKLYRDYLAFEKMCLSLAKIMDNTPASFVFLPFGNGFPYNDKIANSRAYAFTKYWRKNLLLFDNLSVQETLDIFSTANAAITTRLHAAIFSCLSHIPFVDITHHTKNQMFMELIGKKDWSVDYWELDYWKIFQKINDFIMSDYSPDLEKVHIKLKEQLLDACSFQL